MSSGTIEYDWTQTEEQILVDMIRADNQQRPLTTAMISFGTPEELIPVSNETYNAAVMVSATASAPFRGSQRHRYHRVPVSSFVYQNVTNLTFVIEDYEDPDVFAAELSNRLDIYLTADKLIYDYPTEVNSVPVTISDNSLCYYGTINVFFVNKIMYLDDVIVNQDLVGFGYTL